MLIILDPCIDDLAVPVSLEQPLSLAVVQAGAFSGKLPSFPKNFSRAIAIIYFVLYTPHTAMQSTIKITNSLATSSRISCGKIVFT